MIRLFEQHHIRKIKELDGMWEFTREDQETVYQLSVPGCFEQHPDMLSYRGKGTYRKQIHINNPGTLRLEFKGVSHTADVFFDGKLIAHHYNAFTPFHGIVKNVSQGEHEIKVVVDNSFGEHSSLHIPNDYYTYGGITRPVSVAEIPEVYIERVHFTPDIKNKEWSGIWEVLVRNTSEKTVDVRLSGSLAENKMNTEIVTVPAGGEVTVSMEKEFLNVMTWTPSDPKLYLLETVLMVNDEPVDDLIERVGFRTVKVVGNKIQVNGEAIFLKGFNRHEDHGMAGYAIPLQLMVQDMDLMQDMGANAVRTCHYPNDERFLDLCDERGILVWEENHARGLLLEDMQNPNFDRQCEACIQEMIENHYNHPSIIIWGILNECASETEEGRKKYQKQYDQIKRMDTTRPTTSATCRHFKDICLDLPDIVSFNMYSGWYQDISVQERNDQEIQWIQGASGAGKPIIVSEVGAAAIYGYRDRSRCKWSEERQVDIIKENLNVYMNDENISGVFIWQFADCKVTEEGGWFASRARCHNNKGILDEYRRPKMAYDLVKEMFSY